MNGFESWNDLSEAGLPLDIVFPVLQCIVTRTRAGAEFASVNDVVFMSTNKPAIYAFDVATGVCVWTAGELNSLPRSYALGHAIYGNYIIVGELALAPGLAMYTL